MKNVVWLGIACFAYICVGYMNLEYFTMILTSEVVCRIAAKNDFAIDTNKLSAYYLN